MTATKEDRLNIRTTAEDRALLKTAAELANKPLSVFVVDSARDNAHRLLADQREFVLSEDRWDAFVAALDTTTHRPNLDKVFSTPSVLEEQ